MFPLRFLWGHLERARKSLGVCSFSFFAYGLVSLAGLGAQPAPGATAAPRPASTPHIAALPAQPADLAQAPVQCPAGLAEPAALAPEPVFRAGPVPAEATPEAAVPPQSAPQETAPPQCGPPQSAPPQSAPLQSPPPETAPPQSAPPQSVPPQSAPASITPPVLPMLPMPSPHLGFDRALGVPHTPFGKQIFKVALRHSLNPLLVAAVVQAESDFNPRARSRKGACGLMQVLPATARRFGLYRRRDLFNPAKNLETGARYLRWLVDRFGDDAMRVLAAYNAGEGSVDRFGGLPPFPETRDYVQHIFARLGFTLLLPALSTPAALPPTVADAAILAGTR